MTRINHPKNVAGPGPDGRFDASTVEWLLEDLLRRLEDSIDTTQHTQMKTRQDEADKADETLQEKLKEKLQELGQVRRERSELENELQERDAKIDDLNDQLRRKDEEYLRWEDEKREMMKSMNKAFTQVLQCRNNIQLYCRVLPMKKKKSKKAVTAEPLDWKYRPYAIETPGKQYNFHRVFGPETPTSDVYEVLEPVLEMSKEQCRHALLIAFGESGSGKSTTMFDGFEPHPGKSVLERLGESLWPSGQSSGWRAGITWIEIKTIGAYDLIKKDKEAQRKLEFKDKQKTSNHGLTDDELYTNDSFFKYAGRTCIKKDDGTSVRAPRAYLQRQWVTTREELRQQRDLARKNRESSSTEANSQSSRGCCFLEIRLEYKGERRGVLSLIDLMGKEEWNKVGKDQQHNSLTGHKEVESLCELLGQVATHNNRAALKDSSKKSPKSDQKDYLEEFTPTGQTPPMLARLIFPILRGSISGSGNEAPHVAVLAHVVDSSEHRDQNNATLKWTKRWESTFEMTAVENCVNCKSQETEIAILKTRLTGSDSTGAEDAETEPQLGSGAHVEL